MRTLVIFLLLVCNSAAEIFSSTVLLRKSVEEVKTFDIRQYIHRYVGKNETRRGQLQPALYNLKELHRLIHDPAFLVQHPIFAYKFIRRQVLATDIVKRYITESSLKDTYMDWSKLENHLTMVTRVDLVGSIAGLAKLQHIYRLDTHDMVNGKIGDFSSWPLSDSQTVGLAKLQHIYRLDTHDMVNGKIGEFSSRPLSAAECLHFSDVVRNTDIDTVYVNTLPIAIQLLNEARQKVETQKDNTTDIKHILQSYRNVYVQAGCECADAAQKIYSEMQQLSAPIVNRTSCDGEHNTVCKALTKPSVTSERTRRFHALCRQDKVTLPREAEGHATAAHKLRCRYVHNNDPRLLLQPAKLEELNTLPPYAARFHDIITDGEIEFLKTVSPSSFQRGTTVTKKGSTVSKTKVSQTTTLPPKYMNNELKNMMGRLEAATHLNNKGFEDLVIANYGTGGHYGFHVDFNFESYQNDKDFASKNQRIFTMLLYLTDVEAGGQTCFPNIGVTVPPIKASVLLFRNLYSNGSAVIESMHTSCPVLMGEKWIAIEWVKSFPQLFEYPCTLNSNE